jgi:hypothetical protein
MAARQSLSTNDDDGPTRSCAECGRPLPATSRTNRRFCSTSCRVRHWHASNPSSLDDGGPQHVRLHWHLGRSSPTLWGDIHEGYWRGPEGCPPECAGLGDKYTRSEPVPPGREGLGPIR